jgi:hypothetical protein
MSGNLSPVQFAGVTGVAEPYDLPNMHEMVGTPGSSSAGGGESGGGGTSSGGSGGSGGGTGVINGAFNLAKKVFSNPEVDSVAADAAEAAPEIAETAGIAALAL